MADDDFDEDAEFQRQLAAIAIDDEDEEADWDSGKPAWGADDADGDDADEELGGKGDDGGGVLASLAALAQTWSRREGALRVFEDDMRQLAATPAVAPLPSVAEGYAAASSTVRAYLSQGQVIGGGEEDGTLQEGGAARSPWDEGALDIAGPAGDVSAGAGDGDDDVAALLSLGDVTSSSTRGGRHASLAAVSAQAPVQEAGSTRASNAVASTSPGAPVAYENGVLVAHEHGGQAPGTRVSGEVAEAAATAVGAGPPGSSPSPAIAEDAEGPQDLDAVAVAAARAAVQREYKEAQAQRERERRERRERRRQAEADALEQAAALRRAAEKQAAALEAARAAELAAMERQFAKEAARLAEEQEREKAWLATKEQEARAREQEAREAQERARVAECAARAEALRQHHAARRVARGYRAYRRGAAWNMRQAAVVAIQAAWRGVLARRHAQHLRQQAVARDTLARAQGSGDAAAVMAAAAAARELGLRDEAEEAVARLRGTMASVANAIAAAADKGSREQLGELLERGGRAGVGQAVLSAATARMEARVQRVRAALGAAALTCDAAGLEALASEASLVGVEAAEVEAARARVAQRDASTRAALMAAAQSGTKAQVDALLETSRRHGLKHDVPLALALVDQRVAWARVAAEVVGGDRDPPPPALAAPHGKRTAIRSAGDASDGEEEVEWVDASDEEEDKHTGARAGDEPWGDAGPPPRGYSSLVDVEAWAREARDLGLAREASSIEAAIKQRVGDACRMLDAAGWEGGAQDMRVAEEVVGELLPAHVMRAAEGSRVALEAPQGGGVPLPASAASLVPSLGAARRQFAARVEQASARLQAALAGGSGDVGQVAAALADARRLGLDSQVADARRAVAARVQGALADVAAAITALAAGEAQGGPADALPAGTPSRAHKPATAATTTHPAAAAATASGDMDRGRAREGALAVLRAALGVADRLGCHEEVMAGQVAARALAVRACMRRGVGHTSAVLRRVVLKDAMGVPLAAREAEEEVGQGAPSGNERAGADKGGPGRPATSASTTASASPSAAPPSPPSPFDLVLSTRRWTAATLVGGAEPAGTVVGSMGEGAIGGGAVLAATDVTAIHQAAAFAGGATRTWPFWTPGTALGQARGTWQRQLEAPATRGGTAGTQSSGAHEEEEAAGSDGSTHERGGQAGHGAGDVAGASAGARKDASKSVPMTRAMLEMNVPGVALSEVTRLDLGLENIGSIDQLQHCPQLRALLLNVNCITRIQGLEHTPLLQELSLKDNLLTRVEGLSKLPQLTMLWLDNNHLTSMAGLGACRSLKHLSLSGNTIRSISSLDGPLPHLEHLNLSGNRIRALPPSCLAPFPSLLHLDVSHNAVAALDAAVFWHTPLLRKLLLHHNRLTVLPATWPTALLTELRVSSNRLTVLPALTYLPMLEHLAADDNAIRWLPAGCLRGCVSLRVLDLSFNRLSCVGNVVRGLQGCGALWQLHLSDNQLGSLLGRPRGATLPDPNGGYLWGLLRAAPLLREVDNEAVAMETRQQLSQAMWAWSAPAPLVVPLLRQLLAMGQGLGGTWHCQVSRGIQGAGTAIHHSGNGSLGNSHGNSGRGSTSDTGSSRGGGTVQAWARQDATGSALQLFLWQVLGCPSHTMLRWLEPAKLVANASSDRNALGGNDLHTLLRALAPLLAPAAGSKSVSKGGEGGSRPRPLSAVTTKTLAGPTQFDSITAQGGGSRPAHAAVAAFLLARASGAARWRPPAAPPSPSDGPGTWGEAPTHQALVLAAVCRRQRAEWGRAVADGRSDALGPLARRPGVQGGGVGANGAAPSATMSASGPADNVSVGRGQGYPGSSVGSPPAANGGQGPAVTLAKAHWEEHRGLDAAVGGALALLQARCCVSEAFMRMEAESQDRAVLSWADTWRQLCIGLRRVRRARDVPMWRDEERRWRAAQRIQAHWRGWRWRRSPQAAALAAETAAVHQKKVAAATALQALFRGRRVRQRIATALQYAHASGSDMDSDDDEFEQMFGGGDAGGGDFLAALMEKEFNFDTPPPAPPAPLVPQHVPAPSMPADAPGYGGGGAGGWGSPAWSAELRAPAGNGALLPQVRDGRGGGGAEPGGMDSGGVPGVVDPRLAYGGGATRGGAENGATAYWQEPRAMPPVRPGVSLPALVPPRPPAGPSQGLHADEYAGGGSSSEDTGAGSHRQRNMEKGKKVLESIAGEWGFKDQKTAALFFKSRQKLMKQGMIKQKQQALDKDPEVRWRRFKQSAEHEPPVKVLPKKPRARAMPEWATPSTQLHQGSILLKDRGKLGGGPALPGRPHSHGDVADCWSGHADGDDADVGSGSDGGQRHVPRASSSASEVSGAGTVREFASAEPNAKLLRKSHERVTSATRAAAPLVNNFLTAPVEHVVIDSPRASKPRSNRGVPGQRLEKQGHQVPKRAATFIG
eukprot:jgi/Mesvir1/5417/Mv15482-RA.1